MESWFPFAVAVCCGAVAKSANGFVPQSGLYKRWNPPHFLLEIQFNVCQNIEQISPNLLEFDKITANVLNSVTLSLDLGRVGMTFSQDGTFLIVDGEADATDTLYTLDPTTGILTSIGHTGLDNGLVGLAYIPEPSTLVLLLVGVVVSVRGRRLLRRGR